MLVGGDCGVFKRKKSDTRILIFCCVQGTQERCNSYSMIDDSTGCNGRMDDTASFNGINLTFYLDSVYIFLPRRE